MKYGKKLLSLTLFMILLIISACSTSNIAPANNPPITIQQKQSTVQQNVKTTLQIYKGHGGDPILSAAWSPDRKLIASAGMDGNLNLWEPFTGKTVRTYKGIAGQILWSSDSKRIAVTSWRAMLESGEETVPVYILDPSSSDVLLRLSVLSKAIQTIAWSPDNTQLASMSVDGEIQIWDSNSGTLLNSYLPHYNRNFPSGFAWSPDGKYIAYVIVTDSDPLTEVIIWDTTRKEIARTYRLPVRSLAWASDSTRLLSIKPLWSNANDNFLDKGEIMIWDVTTGKALLTYQGHTDQVLDAAWSPDNQYIASGGRDKTVQIFDAKTGKTFSTYAEHQKEVSPLAWSPDGKMIVSCDMGGACHVWEAQSRSTS